MSSVNRPDEDMNFIRPLDNALLILPGSDFRASFGREAAAKGPSVELVDIPGIYAAVECSLRKDGESSDVFPSQFKLVWAGFDK